VLGHSVGFDQGRVFAGKNSAGVGEDEDFSESISLAWDQAFAGSICSLWTSGISPSECFSHEQMAITAVALRTDTAFAAETRIMRGTVTVLQPRVQG
jgi:hypothetical protein